MKHAEIRIGKVYLARHPIKGNGCLWRIDSVVRIPSRDWTVKRVAYRYNATRIGVNGGEHCTFKSATSFKCESN